MKQKSRFYTARRILIFWTLFIGLGAMAGALAMLLDPSGKSMGMDAMLPYFQVLPFADVVFQDFAFSGWALLIRACAQLLHGGGGENQRGGLHSCSLSEQRL